MRKSSPKPRISWIAAAALAAIGSGPAQGVAVGWTGGSSFWDLATNWGSNPLLPGAGDDVVIDVAGLQTITHRSGVDLVNSLAVTGNDVLALTGGTLTVGNAFTANGGVSVGAGTLALNGASGAASLVLSGGVLGGTGALVTTGASTWLGGTQAGTGSSTFNAVLSINGAAAKAITGGRALVLNGSTTWGGNTANANNAIQFNTGTITNNGSFNDANGFASLLGRSGGSNAFNNAGTYNKLSNTVTTVEVAFNNTGLVNVDAGSLLLQAGSTSSGTFHLAAGTAVEYRNGVHTLNNFTSSGAGSFTVSTDNVGADAFVSLNGGSIGSRFVFSGSTIGGTDRVFSGPATWSGGTFSGTAVTSFDGDLAISGPNTKVIVGGGTVNLNGTTTWSGNTADNNNAIRFWNGATINNHGSFNDSNAFASFIEHNVGGPHNFNNTGTFNKTADTVTTFDLGVNFNNTGVVNVNAGTLRPAGGTSTGVFNLAPGATLEFRNGGSTLNHTTIAGAGTLLVSTDNVGADAFVTLNGGTLTTPFLFSGSAIGGTDRRFQGPATWTGGGFSGPAVSDFDNTLVISGPNTKSIVGGGTLDLNDTTTWSGNTADNNNAIRFWNGATINNHGSFNDSNAFASFIEHNVGGPHAFNNLGTYNKLSNTITTVDLGVGFNNTGTLNLEAGTMRFRSGTQGPLGTVNVAPTATYQHDAASTVGRLVDAGKLVLDTRTLTVFIDYDNANFGSGNAFNRRANVSTTGTGNRLLAGGDSNQAVSGAGITGGNTTTPTLLIGNLHVGANTFHYDIANAGSTGPALRGAVQDAVNGASVTDARLSGSGVTAGAWGPVTPGAQTARDVIVTVAQAGVLAPLAGQAVSIVNNFENTRQQLLTFVSAAGAAAYHLASGSVTPNPLQLPNQRVGGTATAALTVTNTAPPGTFTERLNASFGTLTGAVLGNGGSLSLAGGASDNNTLQLRLDTTQAGQFGGSATLQLASDGGGSSQLGVTTLAPQVVAVSGQVFQPAVARLNTAALDFGTVQVGQGVQQVLSFSNIATGATGFVEDLNVRFGASSGTGAGRIGGSGSVTGLPAGATHPGAMTVIVDTSSAGVVNGAIGIDYFSAGAVNGVSNGLGELSVGSALYGVVGAIQAQGQVISQASPSISNPVIDLGKVRVGAPSPTQAVSIANVATTAPQAALNATVSAAAPIVASGGFTGLAPGASSSAIVLGLNTGTPGAQGGAATVSFVSDASNVGNCAPHCQLDLGTQSVSVSGQVFRLANPVLSPVNVDLAARVGDVGPGVMLQVTNASPDPYTERLNGTFGGVAAGFSASGAISGLGAGASSTALRLSLDTAAAGSYLGSAKVNFVSSGAGTTGAADWALPGQQVALHGRVYTPAIAQLPTSTVDFGIVHRGEAVGARQVSVSNAAALAAPNDTLVGTLGGASGPFTAAGTLAGVAAQATESSSFTVTLDTSSAGVFSGSARASFASHNGELADLALPGAQLTLKAQVNNFAELALGRAGGDGSLTSVARTYTLDFGSIVLGSADRSAELLLSNVAVGPADLLNGSFALGAGAGFTLTGFDAFAGLGAGGSLRGLGITFDSAVAGSFSRTLTVSAFGTNASGYRGDLADTTLVLRGTVTGVTPVPEPASWALLLGGVLGLAALRRSRQAGCGGVPAVTRS